MSAFLLAYLAIGAVFAAWFWFKQRIVKGVTLEELSGDVSSAYDEIPARYRDVTFLKFLGTPAGLAFVHGAAWPLVACVAIRDSIAR